MACEVLQRADPQPLRRASLHADRVAVGKPERPRHHYALRGDALAQIAPAGQQLLREGARVLGIGVDLAAEERLPEDARAAQLAAVIRFHARAPRELRGHLGQERRLGEGLGPDLHHGEEREDHRSRSNGARWAWTKRAT